MTKINLNDAPLSKLLDIKYPIIMAPMFLVSNSKMIIEAMGGLGDNTKEKEEKIIRNITKATTITRNN